MTDKSIPYRQVIHDYFKDFYRDWDTIKNTLMVCLISLSLAILYAWGFHYESDQLDRNGLVGVPIFIAVLSSSSHRVSLPFMMYLIPYSKKQREEYIQKKLVVKVAFPTIFGCLFDITAICFGFISYYAAILQIIGVFLITYMCGVCFDGTLFLGPQVIPAYGKLRVWATSLDSLSYTFSSALFAMCAGALSRGEFWVAFAFLLCLLLVAAMVHKHWKTIRGNFADYEMTIKRTNIW